MTTADYLTQLVKDLDTVRTNLNAQGVVTEPTETLTTLAPKISSIGQDISTVTYMRLFDLSASLIGKHKYKESDYTQSEINKVDTIIDVLGRDLNGE